MDGQTHQIAKWDLVIAHPPCTYLSNAGACRLFPQKGLLDKDRFILGLEAKLFFMAFWFYGFFNCGPIVIENPRPSTIYKLPKHTQIIHPYLFDVKQQHPFTKATLLWIFGVPTLTPTSPEATPIGPYCPSGTSRKNKNTYGYAKRGDDSKERSKTFFGVADAMADQWGDYLISL